MQEICAIMYPYKCGFVPLIKKGLIPMALVTTKEMFAKAYNGGYAVGAFNVNNMEIVQAITEACREEKAPVILQVSKGARAYANPLTW